TQIRNLNLVLRTGCARAHGAHAQARQLRPRPRSEQLEIVCVAMEITVCIERNIDLVHWVTSIQSDKNGGSPLVDGGGGGHLDYQMCVISEADIERLDREKRRIPADRPGVRHAVNGSHILRLPLRLVRQVQTQIMVGWLRDPGRWDGCWRRDTVEVYHRIAK